MNRRLFIRNGAVAAGSVIAGFSILRLSTRPYDLQRFVPAARNLIVDVLGEELAHLKIQDGALAAFAADYAEEFAQLVRVQALPLENKPQLWFHTSTRRYLSSLHTSDMKDACADSEVRGQLALTFLEASSYFYGDESSHREVEYRGLRAIYRPCSNPFARFAFPVV